MAVQDECIVEVWRAEPECIGSAEWRALMELLDGAEQAQVARLRFSADRNAYVLAHGLRRLVLAQWLGTPASAAADLRFGHDAAGRPFLHGTTSRGRQTCFFSHAHAREGVVLAVCREHPVGIDLEPRDGRAPVPGLLRRYIDWPQHSGLNWDSAGGFADGWTALEAFVKALGCGLPGLAGARALAPVQCTTLGLHPAGRNAGCGGGHALLRLGLAAGGPRRRVKREALVLRPPAPPGCAAALAVCQGRQAPPPRLDEHHLDAQAALSGQLR